MFILNFNVNWLSVILMVIASMVIGGLWYSPLLFGKRWMHLTGMTKEHQATAKKNGGKAYAYMLIPSFVKAYMLAFFIKNMFVTGIAQSMLIAALIWIGFVATTNASEYIFNAKAKSWSLYLLNQSYELVLFLTGAIIMSYLR